MRPVRLWFAALSLLTPLLAVDCAGDFIADQNASCTNSTLDKGETAVDCGGTGCPACGREKTCKLDSDCGSGLSCLPDARTATGTLLCQWSYCADNKRSEGETDLDCGGSCWPCKADQKCKTTADCASQVCDAGLCAEASCSDGIQNQDEPDTDCGSLQTKCAGCAAGKSCTIDEHCDSQVCDSGTCARATCNDSRQNGDEGGVDCGGTCATRCSQGSSCTKDADCVSGVCRGNVCLREECADGVRNGTESDVDCGGTCGPTCVDSAGCNVDGDCAHAFCNAHICQLPTCNDGIKNQNESDIDCGDIYGLCVPCTTGQACVAAVSCMSGNCGPTDKRCVAPTCSDRLKNQFEGDVDCGGECTTQKCPTGSTCRVPADCAEGVCSDGRCVAAVCPDGVKNGQETDMDCGGPSSICAIRCGIGLHCKTNADCANNSCFAGICQDPSCANQILDGTETDVDCGGPTCPQCVANKKCIKDEDCLSSNCDDKATLTCVADSCLDGIKNGNETAADCGGNCEKNCVAGQPCLAGSDCEDGVCDDLTKHCTVAACPDGVKNGLETDKDCGGAACLALTVPRLCELNQGCLDDSDCNKTRNLICDAASSKCVKWSCNDQRKNQDESDVDCGGATSGCSKCTTGKSCLAGSDCKDLICTTGINTCAAPKCTDTIKNGDEGDVDCGGSICTIRCPDTKFCNFGSDCVSGVCSATSPQVCLAPKCGDGVKNGDESDADCGGTCAAKCADGKVCKVRTDCANIDPLTICKSVGVYSVCTPPGCNDGQKGPTETGVDCGGSCKPCLVGGGCLVDSDCEIPKSGKCSTAKVCVDASCGDLVQNGAESDADCGGSPATGTYPTCGRCSDGKKCNIPADCASKSCNGTACLPATCGDGIQNGGEVSADCGTACASAGKLCADNVTCASDADCKTGWCTIPTGSTGKICVTPTCTDGMLNGAEGDKDCGATCQVAAKLCKVVNASGVQDGCKKDLDCDSATCSECGGKCIKSANQCYAQGTNCNQCATGQACSTNFDCKSLNCDTTNKVCIAPNNCYGKVIDGTGCSADCMMLIRCLFFNGQTLAAAEASPDSACGTNKFSKGNAIYTEAKTPLANAGCP